MPAVKKKRRGRRKSSLKTAKQDEKEEVAIQDDFVWTIGRDQAVEDLKNYTEQPINIFSVCENCNNMFLTDRELKIHMRKCGEQASSSEPLATRAVSNRIFECILCDETFNDMNELQLHNCVAVSSLVLNVPQKLTDDEVLNIREMLNMK